MQQKLKALTGNGLSDANDGSLYYILGAAMSEFENPNNKCLTLPFSCKYPPANCREGHLLFQLSCFNIV
jgi:hypothetical protein